MVALGKPSLNKNGFTIIPDYKYIHENDTYLFCDEAALYFFKFFSFWNSQVNDTLHFVLKLYFVFL